MMGELPFCDRAGVSRGEASERLSYFGLDATDPADLERVRARIAPYVDRIVDGFYAHLADFEGLRHFLDGPGIVERLRRSMHEYLLHFGEGIGSMAYFEERLRIGSVHERVGLGPKWFLGAFARLFDLIGDTLATASGPDADQHAGPRPSISLLVTAHRVLALDATLMAEMYQHTSTERLEALLDEVNEAQHRLKRSASLDGLTNVLNRDALLENLEVERHRCRCSGQPFALLIIDVDRFKRCNDQFGHGFGDLVLKHVAQRVRSVLRPWDVIGRLGGDEFLVGLVGTPGEEAGKIADRIRLRISLARIETAGSSVTITVSIGIAAKAPREIPSLEVMLQEADRALYRAKAQGRNRTSFVPADAEPVEEREAGRGGA